MKYLAAAQVLLAGALANPQYVPAGYEQQQQPYYAAPQPAYTMPGQQYAPAQQPAYQPYQPQYAQPAPAQAPVPALAQAPGAPLPAGQVPAAAPVPDVPPPPAPYFQAPPRQQGPVYGPRMGQAPWTPKIGQRLQVVLDRRVILQPNERLNPESADIWDLDLINTPKQTIDILHARGKRVVCYLSVGGTESWRADFNEIPKQDIGETMLKWPGEHYLNIRSPAVFRFMQKRIRQAYEKGCDALDPDNVDVFNDDQDMGGGFTPKITIDDSVAFMRKLAAEARKYGMGIGLKNAEEVVPKVLDIIDFAVNEECTTYERGCTQYIPVIQAGKPVFHFEYVNVLRNGPQPVIQSTFKEWQNLTSPQIRDYYCLNNNWGNPILIRADYGRLFTTVIKKLDLAGWVMYCDGSVGDTPTVQDYTSPRDAIEDGDQAGAATSDSGRSQSGRPQAGRPRQQQQQQSWNPFSWLTGGGGSNNDDDKV